MFLKKNLGERRKWTNNTLLVYWISKKYDIIRELQRQSLHVKSEKVIVSQSILFVQNKIAIGDVHGNEYAYGRVNVYVVRIKSKRNNLPHTFIIFSNPVQMVFLQNSAQSMKTLSPTISNLQSLIIETHTMYLTVVQGERNRNFSSIIRMLKL